MYAEMHFICPSLLEQRWGLATVGQDSVQRLKIQEGFCSPLQGQLRLCLSVCTCGKQSTLHLISQSCMHRACRWWPT
jgi:hypothetical protein